MFKRKITRKTKILRVYAFNNQELKLLKRTNHKTSVNNAIAINPFFFQCA